ncbi:putative carboxypeptidase y protein [Venturia nashicola]|uniref:carboxypeptidase C n=1 Tax=Venturia nashicola TaxID=86259 RepID=A0A4Z1P7V3_9PEZI|nr:putative carboxypeptidase y protein [Venturia nashicola]
MLRLLSACLAYLVLLAHAIATDLPPPAALAGTSSTGHAFTIRKQNASLCDAGSTQWTGTVKVSPERSIFFWFYESRNNPSADPLILWLSGGPAASSMMGLLAEVGPCTTDGTTTKRRGPSWSSKANLLFVDQPAGTGFSTVTRASAAPTTLAAASQDMNTFLHVFQTSIFPSLSIQSFHFGGESFAGRYIPAYAKYIFGKQKSKAPDAVPAKIESLVLINAVIDQLQNTLGLVDHFCSARPGENGFGTGFNASACAAMRRGIPECERQDQSCRDTNNLNSCRRAYTTCEDGIGKYFQNDVVPGGRNPYDDRLNCTTPPACRAKSYDRLVKYCNLPSVQSQLGFSTPIKFQGINFELNSRWSAAGDPLLPATKDLAYLLDETSIKILFINGNNDVVVNTPGQIRALDALVWSQQSRYRQEQFKPWGFSAPGGKAKKSGMAKGVDRLKLVTVDNAGHEVPSSQPEACLAVLNNWLENKVLESGRILGKGKTSLELL